MECYCCSFRINRESDPQRQFSVDPQGFISVARELDREKISEYLLRVEVTDGCRRMHPCGHPQFLLQLVKWAMHSCT